MIFRTRASLARISKRSLIVSSSVIVFLLDAFALEAGELIEAQIENVADLLFGKPVLSLDNARLIADQDPDLLDRLCASMKAPSALS